MEYDFELQDAIEFINKEKFKLVAIQMPDGLKPKAVEISEQLERNTGAKILIWMDSCFGSCDLPLELKNLKVEALIHFGHSPWPFWDKKLMEF